MRKFFLFFSLIIFTQSFSQHVHEYCGFDEVMRRIDAKNPENVRKRQAIEAKLAHLDKTSYLNKFGVTTSYNGLYSGQIFEIPVVVHIIESQASANANLHVTDQEIIDWIDRANRMYATTYGNGFYPEGNGPDGGAVIPFKLVLAKRSPSCTPTTGIVRYNGSVLPSYDTYGVAMQGQNGVTNAQIKNELAPHWPEDSYFNIYVVIGFDGEQQLSYGLMGFAAFPDTYDYSYESFMKVATIKKQHDTTLTHELGHAFGLYHTFQGVAPTNQTSCPPNNDCATDGDLVCDTSPSRSMYGVTVPDNTATDPCTGQNYDGTQYNVMNYTNTNRKFTPGQRDRAVMLMMEYRKNLLESLAAKDPSQTVPSPVSVIAAQCNPPGIAHPANNNYAIGATHVNFGNISSTTNGYDSDESSPDFYSDFAEANCIRPAYYTDIPSDTGTELKITYLYTFNQPEKFRTKAWIDYNNNGVFEDSELVVNHLSGTLTNSGMTITGNITPPPSAVKNTYLRMRIAVDAATYNSSALPDLTPCSQLQFGQMEDYAVRIINKSLSVFEINGNSRTKLVYLKSENKLRLTGGNNLIFGEYQMYDASGKLIQKGASDNNEVQINQILPKGIYIINHFNKKLNKQSSDKFLID